ncbi:hypothetical protein LCGC14_0372190 [marine sediment metagenome]|uniref:Uncharacterized protein n=1 Tax=marine sediment metagenome TaxID=412755 RepID=A0A0F9WD79_9ZZZZ
MKKQAVLVRVPGLQAYDKAFKALIGEKIQKVLQPMFDKEVVVLVVNEDIHFMDEADIRDLIDTMENLIK